MKDPIPQASTFAKDLAFTLLDSFAEAYWVSGTDTQRKAVLRGCEQIIDCRIKMMMAEAQTIRPGL